jgi:hypothetical protein
MISSEKLMGTIARNSDVSHAIGVLSKGQKPNADYDSSFVLAVLSKIAKLFRNEARREWIVHADLAHPHSTKLTIKFCANIDLRVAP